MIKRLQFILFLLIPVLVFAVHFSGKCISVIDGDTIGVLRDGKEVKIRLDGIDCPEMGQDFGSKAKKFTSSLAYGKIVEIYQKDLDKYGRLVARVVVDGKDVSFELVRAGLAWHYTQFSKDTVLSVAETQARQAEEGLWALSNPVAPWDYRHGSGVQPQAKTQESISKAPELTQRRVVTVYITRTGSKYHGVGCQYLRKSKIPVSKSDAISRGYAPCSKCNP